MRQATGNLSIHLFLLLAFAAPTGVHAAKPISAREAQIQRTADDFEALMLQKMWSQMRQSADQINAGGGAGFFAPSRAELIFRSMQEEQMLQALAKQRPLGVGNLVAKQLKGELGVGGRNLLKYKRAPGGPEHGRQTSQ